MLLLQFFKKFCFFFLIFSLFSNALAQTRAKATVSPFIIEERVSPGENFVRQITLTNDSDEKLVFLVEIRDIRHDEKGNLILSLPGTERFSLAEWLEVKEKEIEILPGESKKINLYFKIPQKEAVGSRQGAVIFTSKFEPPQAEREGIFGAISHQIGVLVFLFSKKDVKEEAQILKFETDKKIYFTPILVKFLIEIENLGNVYLEPTGKIEIEGFPKKQKFQLLFNKERLKILPESKRIFEETWQEKFGFGKYEAKLYLTFGTPKNQGGSGIKTIFAKTNFYVFPLREISFLALIFFIFFLLIWRYKKISRKLKEKYGDKNFGHRSP